MYLPAGAAGQRRGGGWQQAGLGCCRGSRESSAACLVQGSKLSQVLKSHWLELEFRLFNDASDYKSTIYTLLSI